MSNKLGISKGNWIISDNGRSIEIHLKRVGYGSILSMHGKVRWQQDIRLIADAGTTANKCGKLPSQLLQENEEMKVMLDRLFCRIEKTPQTEILIRDYKQLLTKINQ